MISVPEAWQLPRMPSQAGLLAEGLDQRLREAGARLREVAPVERHGNAGYLPMAGRRVLALGQLAGASELRGCIAFAFEPRRPPAGCKTAGFSKTHPDEIRKLQRTLPPAVVRLAVLAGLRNVADGVGALVAILRGVGSAADSDGVHDKDHGAHAGTVVIAGWLGAAEAPVVSQ